MEKLIILGIWQILAHYEFKIHWQILKSSCLANKKFALRILKNSTD